MPSASVQVIRSDARWIPSANNYFDAIVTSPPYFGLRSYGDSDSEIGIGTVEHYLSGIDECAKEWKRVLKDDGLLWVNIGDTASGSGGAGGDYKENGSKAGKPKYRQGNSGRAKMQWLNIPHRVVEVFVDNGWLYRSCITWDKEMLRPEDLKHARRPGVSSEFIFMFAKDRKHRFYADRLTEKGNVWHFKPERKTKHLAPFPAELPRRCIEVSTNVGDWVLDPFSGSNTTVNVAGSMGRNAVGCDLYAADFSKVVDFE